MTKRSTPRTFEVCTAKLQERVPRKKPKEKKRVVSKKTKPKIPATALVIEKTKPITKRIIPSIQNEQKVIYENKKPKLTPYTEQYAAKAKEFYFSPAWRYLRYDVFLRDGKICAVCGATPEDGTRLHVDHIIPLRQDWSLRLKAENLQVLCEECNQGKGSRDSTDWRPRRGRPTQN